MPIPSHCRSGAMTETDPPSAEDEELDALIDFLADGDPQLTVQIRRELAPRAPAGFSAETSVRGHGGATAPRLQSDDGVRFGKVVWGTPGDHLPGPRPAPSIPVPERPRKAHEPINLGRLDENAIAPPPGEITNVTISGPMFEKPVVFPGPVRRQQPMGSHGRWLREQVIREARRRADRGAEPGVDTGLPPGEGEDA